MQGEGWSSFASIGFGPWALGPWERATGRAWWREGIFGHLLELMIEMYELDCSIHRGSGSQNASTSSLFSTFLTFVVFLSPTYHRVLLPSPSNIYSCIIRIRVLMLVFVCFPRLFSLQLFFCFFLILGIPIWINIYMVFISPPPSYSFGIFVANYNKRSWAFLLQKLARWCWHAQHMYTRIRSSCFSSLAGLLAGLLASLSWISWESFLLYATEAFSRIYSRMSNGKLSFCYKGTIA